MGLLLSTLEKRKYKLAILEEKHVAQHNSGRLGVVQDIGHDTTVSCHYVIFCYIIQLYINKRKGVREKESQPSLAVQSHEIFSFKKKTEFQL